MNFFIKNIKSQNPRFEKFVLQHDSHMFMGIKKRLGIINNFEMTGNYNPYSKP